MNGRSGRVTQRHLAALVTSALLFATATATAQQPAPGEPRIGDEPDPWKADGGAAQPVASDPAREADPPPIPPPPPPDPEPPTSTSGSALTPSSSETRLVPGPAARGPRGDARLMRGQDARIRALERRLRVQDERLRALERSRGIWNHLTFGGFVQPQLVVNSYNTAASPSAGTNGGLPDGIAANDVVARADGTTSNTTSFRMRRTRLRTKYETESMRLFVQLDVLPVGGFAPGVGSIVRNAEATGIARWSRDVRTEIGAGVIFLPLRGEMLEQADTRNFAERTSAVLNMAPGERDLGVHARTLALRDRLLVDVGVVNGQRIGQATWVATPDLNKSKDVYAYLSYELGVATLGVSGYLGRGERVDGQRLAFKQFRRWLVNYMGKVHYKVVPALGESRLLIEFALTQNMDTGINYAFAAPAIPVDFRQNVTNLDGRAVYIRAEQELTKWAELGLRYDSYTPDTTDRGNDRDTFAAVATLRFTQNLKWMNEVDYTIDDIRPTGAPKPSREIFTYSSILQARF
ncbi:MAG: hypothetical protein KC657_01915 [Myxococcales bacterium]|nr:hypothetical protein [Myxococcales bacterium]